MPVTIGNARVISEDSSGPDDYTWSYGAVADSLGRATNTIAHAAGAVPYEDSRGLIGMTPMKDLLEEDVTLAPPEHHLPVLDDVKVVVEARRASWGWRLSGPANTLDNLASSTDLASFNVDITDTVDSGFGATVIYDYRYPGEVAEVIWELAPSQTGGHEVAVTDVEPYAEGNVRIDRLTLSITSTTSVSDATVVLRGQSVKSSVTRTLDIKPASGATQLQVLPPWMAWGYIAETPSSPDWYLAAINRSAYDCHMTYPIWGPTNQHPRFIKNLKPGRRAWCRIDSKRVVPMIVGNIRHRGSRGGAPLVQLRGWEMSGTGLVNATYAQQDTLTSPTADAEIRVGTIPYISDSEGGASEIAAPPVQGNGTTRTQGLVWETLPAVVNNTVGGVRTRLLTEGGIEAETGKHWLAAPRHYSGSTRNLGIDPGTQMILGAWKGKLVVCFQQVGTNIRSTEISGFGRRREVDKIAVGLLDPTDFTVTNVRLITLPSTPPAVTQSNLVNAFWSGPIAQAGRVFVMSHVHQVNTPGRGQSYLVPKKRYLQIVDLDSEDDSVHETVFSFTGEIAPGDEEWHDTRQNIRIDRFLDRESAIKDINSQIYGYTVQVITGYSGDTRLSNYYKVGAVFSIPEPIRVQASDMRSRTQLEAALGDDWDHFSTSPIGNGWAHMVTVWKDEITNMPERNMAALIYPTSQPWTGDIAQEENNFAVISDDGTPDWVDRNLTQFVHDGEHIWSVTMESTGSGATITVRKAPWKVSSG